MGNGGLFPSTRSSRIIVHQKDILLDLPEQLIACILDSWLASTELFGTLDIAYCNRYRRQTYLVSIQCSYHFYHNRYPYVKRLRFSSWVIYKWLITRGMRFQHLQLNQSNFDQVIQYDLSKFSAVTFVANGKQVAPPHKLREMLQQMPSITDIDLASWKNVDDQVILDLIAVPLNLKKLAVNYNSETYSRDISNISIIPVLQQFRYSLEELDIDCPLLTNDALLALSACQQIRRLTLNYFANAFSPSALYECCKALSHLEHLVLEDSLPKLLELFYTPLAPALPNLKVLSLNGCMFLHCLPSYLRSCPRLEAIRNTVDTRLHCTSNETNTSIIKEVYLKKPRNHVADHKDVFDQLSQFDGIIIHSLVCFEYPISSRALTTIANTLSDHLLYIQGDIQQQLVSIDSMKHFATSCMNLEEVTFKGDGNDALLAALVSNCSSSLISLSWCSTCPSFSLTLIVLHALARLPQLKRFTLESLHSINDDAFMMILESLPCLEELNIAVEHGPSAATLVRALQRYPICYFSIGTIQLQWAVLKLFDAMDQEEAAELSKRLQLCG